MTPDRHLLLVRHAEPADRDHCHGSRSDPVLSARGRVQADDLVERIAVLLTEVGPGTRLVRSPAARAAGTAAPLAAALDLDHEVDARWRERDFGAWEGRPWTELWPTVPREVTADAAAYLDWTPPGGEPSADVATRVRAALHDQAAVGPGATVVVAHAGTIRHALAAALDLPLAATLRIDVPYASITALAMTDDAATLTRVGA